MSDRLALANAIEDAGIERAKAERVASVIFDAIHDNVATKADVQASEAAVRHDLQASTAATRADIAATRTELKSDIAVIRSAMANETARHMDEIGETGTPPMSQPVLNARALKCTVVLDPAEVAQIVAADGKPRVVIDIRLPDRRVSVDLNAKSVRKTIAAISEYGPSRWSSRASWSAMSSPTRGSPHNRRRGHRQRRRRQHEPCHRTHAPGALQGFHRAPAQRARHGRSQPAR